MSSLTFWRLMIRIGLLLGMAGLAWLGLYPDRPVHAEEALSPLLQSTEGYPILTPAPTDDFQGYPAQTDVPTVAGPTPTVTVTLRPGQTVTVTNTPQAGETLLPTDTPFVVGSETPTPDLSVTVSPDAFRTEDAEMGGSRNGTPTTQTPTPRETASPTISPTPFATDGVMRTMEAEEKEDGFEMDWGLFWIGFSIPVVGACGVVLYMLDRRPELFRPKRK